MTPADFLGKAVEHARAASGAGAPIHPPAAAAHAANETGYGRSGLTQQANNLFGIKATGQHTPFWAGEYVEMPTWEVIDGQNVTVQARFRKYASWADSFGDYGDVIRRVYPTAATARSGAGFLSGLFLAGPRKWATDPAAFDKCARILGTYEDTLEPREDYGTTGRASTLVLHNLSEADRWAALSKDPVLRGSFVWRAREGKLDVRRAS